MHLFHIVVARLLLFCMCVSVCVCECLASLHAFVNCDMPFVLLVCCSACGPF